EHGDGHGRGTGRGDHRGGRRDAAAHGMTSARATIAALAWACALLLGLVVVGSDTPAAAVTTTAVVVVDTGSGVQSFTVGVGGGVSGVAALQAAVGAGQVATSVFGGNGVAVCSILGVGNDPSHCLIGPGGAYWAYWRATGGATTWSYSGVGAGATTVKG